MLGKHITQQQVKLYMSHRKQGERQASASAKAGVSQRTGRCIEAGQLNPLESQERWARLKGNSSRSMAKKKRKPKPAMQALDLRCMDAEVYPEFVTQAVNCHERWGTVNPDGMGMAAVTPASNQQAEGRR